MFGKRNARVYVSKSWPDGCYKISRDMKGIKKYYDEFTRGNYGVVDDETFSDLNLDIMYKEMDGTYSSAGESKLYDMLRNPVRNKEILNERSNFMEHFSINTKNRIEVQSTLYELNNDKNFNFLELLTNEYKGSKFKKRFYFILGKVLPLLFFIFGFIYNPMFIFLGSLVIINPLITSIERLLNSNKPYSGIYYATKLIRCGIKLTKLNIDVLKPYQRRIDTILKNLGPEIKNLKKVSGIMGGFLEFSFIEPFLELAGAVFLSSDIAYYKLIDNLNLHKKDLKKLYDIIGEIDALIAVQGYKEKSDYETVKPEFEMECGFKIVHGVHPLIENPVENSITITNKGIVLTGTNMSGKSTFLKMIGINIILAQSFNFVHGKEYKAEFFNFISSINPQDDISRGKSYYLAEAESVLRIINALHGEYRVFCCIDEIFRGTNPQERIAASQNILKYIQSRNSLSIVTTHDKELTTLLIQSHDFYYFSEDVSTSTGLTFDYKLKAGVSKTRNAIKLLKYVGYPDEIVDGAYSSILSNI